MFYKMSHVCQKKNIKIFRVNSNKNLIPLSRASVNRIQLLKNATGPYVMLLDGDDEYIDVVDDGVEFLNDHPDFVAVAYNLIEFYEKKSVYKKVQDPYPKKKRCHLFCSLCWKALF